MSRTDNAAAQQNGDSRIWRWISRPYRLAGLAVLLALAFVPGRLYILGLLALVSIVVGIRDWKRGGSSLVWVVLFILGLGIMVQYVSYRDVRELAEYYEANTPIDLAIVSDGTYAGETQALNGPLELEIDVKDGAIAAARLIYYQEVVYAFDELLQKVVGITDTDLLGMEGFVFRSERDVAAFQRAMENALLSARGDMPGLNPLTRASFFIAQNRAGRITFNAIAVLFIVMLLFDFVIEPALAPGTGQSLTCYNCQACVGVCPVKMVDGDPFPMIMIIEARAGNYERVAELAKYCVACGNCAAKCPVGNSGPSVAAASVVIDRRRRRDEARRAAARAREVPGA